MKVRKIKLIAGVVFAAGGLLMAAPNAEAQGTVNFSNGVQFQTATDQSRLVYFGSVQTPGNELVGTNFRAQLYYGASADNLQAVATTGNAFRAPGTTTPGTWSSGGTRILNGFTAGNTVILQVRIWDSSTGATWEQATVRGSSQPFTYVIPAPGSLASAFYMENFRAVFIPEPSVSMLLLVGLAGFMVRCRRERC